MVEEILTEAFASELEKLAFDPLSALVAAGAVGGGIAGAADPASYMMRTAAARSGTDRSQYVGGRNAAKSSLIREIFQPRAAAVKTWRDNMMGMA
jgi:hypothetical protein